MRIIRIAENTQLALELPITIYGARLSHTATTTADIYDEVDSTSTAAKKKIALRTLTNYHVKDNARIPKSGIKFTEGCYIAYALGEIFLTVN